VKPRELTIRGWHRYCPCPSKEGYEKAICNTGYDADNILCILAGSLSQLSGYTGKNYERE
jgi:hypothetical protein